MNNFMNKNSILKTFSVYSIFNIKWFITSHKLQIIDISL